MHRILKRAAASAIPALLGLVVSPATAMAAPHTSRAVAGPAAGGREVHARLAQLPQSGATQRHQAGIISAAMTTTYIPWSNGTDDDLAATPSCPILAFGGPGIGILNLGKNDQSIGNHIANSGGSGCTLYWGITGSETGSVGSTGSTNAGNGAGANNTGNGAGKAIAGNGTGVNKTGHAAGAVPAP